MITAYSEWTFAIACVEDCDSPPLSDSGGGLNYAAITGA
jgi:hypothetical protein